MAQPCYPPGPGQQGYPLIGQHRYPPLGQPGYPPLGQPGYPPPGQSGYPPPGQSGYPAGQPPIMQQPGYIAVPGQPEDEQWMQLTTQPPPNCPPGLEYLTQIDQLIVKQIVGLFQAFTGFETNNKYKMHNSLGQNVYFAVDLILHNLKY